VTAWEDSTPRSGSGWWTSGATVIVAVVVELNVATGGGAGSHPLNALAYVLGGILPIPVLFRRKWPLPVLIACSVLPSP
jgi:hypothetical protein